MINIFLSASVPLPDRDPKFMKTADVVAIREAIKALIGTVVPRGKIVFGGHPAITPLVALLLRGMGNAARKRVILYRSAFFTDQLPAENDEFLDYATTPNVQGSRDASLHDMRCRMINDTPFHAGVFIGGMEGVVEEFKLFREVHPAAKIWPLASTGAAALDIYTSLDRPRPELFLREMTYQTLFRQLVGELRS